MEKSRDQLFYEHLCESILFSRTIEEFKGQFNEAVSNGWHIDYVPNKSAPTLLQLAIRRNQLNYIEFLLQEKADVNILNVDGNNALMLAVNCSCPITLIEKIILKTENINAQAYLSKTTALSYACEKYMYGETEYKKAIIYILLRAGADPALAVNWECNWNKSEEWAHRRQEINAILQHYILSQSECKRISPRSAYEYEL